MIKKPINWINYFSYIIKRGKEKEEKYIEEIEKQPFVGLMEWVDLMVDYGGDKPI